MSESELWALYFRERSEAFRRENPGLAAAADAHERASRSAGIAIPSFSSMLSDRSRKRMVEANMANNRAQFEAWKSGRSQS